MNEDIIPQIPQSAVDKLCELLIRKNLKDTEELRIVAKKQIIRSVLFLEELGATVIWKNGVGMKKSER